MKQKLNICIDEKLKEYVSKKAKEKDISISNYISSLIKKEVLDESIIDESIINILIES